MQQFFMEKRKFLKKDSKMDNFFQIHVDSYGQKNYFLIDGKFLEYKLNLISGWVTRALLDAGNPNPKPCATYSNLSELTQYKYLLCPGVCSLLMLEKK